MPLGAVLVGRLVGTCRTVGEHLEGSVEVARSLVVGWESGGAQNGEGTCLTGGRKRQGSRSGSGSDSEVSALLWDGTQVGLALRSSLGHGRGGKSAKTAWVSWSVVVAVIPSGLWRVERADGVQRMLHAPEGFVEGRVGISLLRLDFGFLDDGQDSPALGKVWHLMNS